jgi:hypothetical protein
VVCSSLELSPSFVLSSSNSPHNSYYPHSPPDRIVEEGASNFFFFFCESGILLAALRIASYLISTRLGFFLSPQFTDETIEIQERLNCLCLVLFLYLSSADLEQRGHHTEQILRK